MLRDIGRIYLTHFDELLAFLSKYFLNSLVMKFRESKRMTIGYGCASIAKKGQAQFVIRKNQNPHSLSFSFTRLGLKARFMPIQP